MQLYDDVLDQPVEYEMDEEERDAYTFPGEDSDDEE